MKKKNTTALWDKIHCQYWLNVMDDFKYSDHCGFYTKISGFDRFVIDRVNSPYTQSFFRLSDYNFISSTNIIIVLCNIGFQTFKNTNSFLTYISDTEDKNNVEKILRERNEENNSINGKDIHL